MKLVEAERKAKALMKEHNLAHWDFAFDRGTRRLGATWLRREKITVSTKFVELNDWEEVKETMLHEIAHAHTQSGHSWEWKRFYKSIGGNPERSYANMISPTMYKNPITGKCPNCGVKVQAKARTASACRLCCKKYNGGRFSEKYKFVWEEK